MRSLKKFICRDVRVVSLFLRVIVADQVFLFPVFIDDGKLWLLWKAAEGTTTTRQEEIRAVLDRNFIDAFVKKSLDN